jgi:hypothetical protein
MTDDIAPVMNWPSMAMLTTPDLSHKVPDSDPKMRNVAAATDAARIPVSCRCRPDTLDPRATQMRNPSMKSMRPVVRRCGRVVATRESLPRPW